MRPNTSINIKSSDASKDQNGIVIDASSLFAMSAQAVVAGTSTGTLNIQASNDIAPALDSNGNPAPTNWSNIATVGVVAIAGAGIYFIPKFDIAYQWVRSVFVHDNGDAGTISVNIKTSGI